MTTLELPQIDGSHCLTHSRLATLKTCPKKHWYAYELGLRPSRDGDALRIGSAFHMGLEVWGNTGSMDEAVGVVRNNYEVLPAWALDNDEAETEWHVERHKVERMLSGYAWRWGNDPLEVVATEQVFDLPIRNPATGAATPTFRLGGKIDKIVKLADGRLAVLEYKTTGEEITADSDYWKRLRIDQQISLYMLAARDLGYDVQTVIYDVTRKPSISPKKLSQGDTATFISTGEYFGEKFTLGMDGERYTVNGCPVELDATGKKPVIRETPAMYAARFTADIAERPDFYYARMEIPRLEPDLEQFTYELWDMQKTLREMQLNDRHYRNTSACMAMSRCQYLDLCLTNYQPDEGVPSGFVRVGHVHQELQEV